MLNKKKLHSQQMDVTGKKQASEKKEGEKKREGQGAY
jgi:hypothetical protein